MASNTKTTKGLLGTKLGMTQVWDENNKLVPVPSWRSRRTS